ncbi:hypothetical protein VKT23_003049 [Stygiomarasmius scandens]|uniref:Uncharacterized protein n=1 Tax=Marasmiellus scandens TaxID=2682957 RepID=A0ABR1K1R2_9AGAR
MARLEAEKELARRKQERITSKNGIEEGNALGLVLHPTASSLGQRGLLAPYTPNQPGWSIENYAPSADMYLKEEDFRDMMIEAAKEVNGEF